MAFYDKKKEKAVERTHNKSFCAKAKTKQTSRQFRKYDLTSVV